MMMKIQIASLKRLLSSLDELGCEGAMFKFDAEAKALSVGGFSWNKASIVHATLPCPDIAETFEAGLGIEKLQKALSAMSVGEVEVSKHPKEPGLLLKQGRRRVAARTYTDCERAPVPKAEPQVKMTVAGADVAAALASAKKIAGDKDGNNVWLEAGPGGLTLTADGIAGGFEESFECAPTGAAKALYDGDFLKALLSIPDGQVEIAFESHAPLVAKFGNADGLTCLAALAPLTVPE